MSLGRVGVLYGILLPAPPFYFSNLFCFGKFFTEHISNVRKACFRRFILNKIRFGRHSENFDLEIQLCKSLFQNKFYIFRKSYFEIFILEFRDHVQKYILN